MTILPTTKKTPLLVKSTQHTIILFPFYCPHSFTSTPGKIINHPNGTDVYQGVPKDYVCGSVRPDIFLQVADQGGGEAGGWGAGGRAC